MHSLLRSTTLTLVVLLAACARPAETPANTTPASGTFTHDGVTLYYETYGDGPPLLLVHGNGGSIGTLAPQIAFFMARYKVIAMDSRDQGRSGDSDSPITYEKMADDLAALIDHLKSGPVDVVGWSDGGIEALLLGVRHPTKVKKLVAMAANLNPGEQAFYKETDELVKKMLAAMPESVRHTPQGKREYKVVSMMLKEPHIDAKLLRQITSPTLVLAGDHDLIRTEHIVEIYNQLPNANLAIFPNSTHMVPYDDPALFNTTVERFLTTPFVKKDRIADAMKTFEKILAGLPK